MILKKNNFLFILLVLLFNVGAGFGQGVASLNNSQISLMEYLSMVGKNNLGLAVQKFNINISEANIETSKIFPDPQIYSGWFDNGNKRMGMGYGFGSNIFTTIELGAKRKARIDLAKSQTELARYLLSDFFRNLRADATLAYLTALQNKNLAEVQQRSYLNMQQLAFSDSIRFKLGSIREIDARQSKLEAGTMLSGVLQNQVNFKISLFSLGYFLGKQKKDTLFIPEGDFKAFDRDFNLSELITTAQNNRSDLLAATQNRDVSQKMLRLAKANRVIDLGVYSGVSYATYDQNIIAPTPSFTQLSAGLTIPLKFSNKYAGELKLAHYTNRQAEVYLQQTDLLIETEVNQAYFNYISTRKQVSLYDNGLLEEGKKVLEGKIFSYKRGESSLTEVLIAQRTYNNVQLDYYQALYNYAAALVELERTSGTWDINF